MVVPIDWGRNGVGAMVVLDGQQSLQGCRYQVQIEVEAE